jgi:cytochrome P450
MGLQSGLFHGITSTVSFTNVIWLAVIWVGYRVYIALYNISPLHPLSQFPGPKIAAASYFYEAYYDWWLRGRYGKVIAQMHEQYGPVIRINPDELHCSDPAFTEEIYAGHNRVRDKWSHQLNTGAAGPLSVAGISTVNHELHRMRRAPFSKFFSRQQVLKLEVEVLDLAQKTTNKMLASAGKGAFNVKEALNCYTSDVISQYAFGEPMGFVAQEGWEPNFATWVKLFIQSAYMMRFNAPARKMARAVPFLANYMGKDIKAVMKVMHVTIPGYIQASLKNPENGRVFGEVMGDEKTMSAEERYRFSGEGFNFLAAGTETTSVSYSKRQYNVHI